MKIKKKSCRSQTQCLYAKASWNEITMRVFLSFFFSEGVSSWPKYLNNRAKNSAHSLRHSVLRSSLGKRQKCSAGR